MAKSNAKPKKKRAESMEQQLADSRKANSGKKKTASRSSKKTSKAKSGGGAAPKKEKQPKKRVVKPKAGKVVQAKSPDGTFFQRRVNKLDVPVACVFVKLNQDSKWYPMCWNSDLERAQAREAQAQRLYIDKKSGSFIKGIFSETKIVTDISEVKDHDGNLLSPTETYRKVFSETKKAHQQKLAS